MAELAMTARCSICQRVFAGPNLVLVGMGVDAGNNRLMQFAEKLAAHLAEKHKDAFNEILMGGQEYQGMLILSRYQTEDASLKEQFDVCRWKVHQATLNTRLTDDQIRNWIDQVVPDIITLASTNNTAEIKRNLIGMITAVRDNLEEPGKYTFKAFDVPSGKAS